VLGDDFFAARRRGGDWFCRRGHGRFLDINMVTFECTTRRNVRQARHCIPCTQIRYDLGVAEDEIAVLRLHRPGLFRAM
jgi:hypothetical protein